MAKVNTNISYNGNFITIDTKTDYQSKINDAVKKGDYASAAKAEAERNAKLVYLGRGNEVTNNYVRPYTASNGSSGKGTNNKGGLVFTDKNTGISDLPSNWTSTKLNGATYTRDKNGNIFQIVGANQNGNTYSLVGNGINKDTGEFTFANPQSARDEAYRQYIMSGGNKNVSKEYALNNLIDSSYIDSLLNGTVNDFNSKIIAEAKAKQEAEKARLAALAEKYGSTDNSFESDYDENNVITAPSEPVVIEEPVLNPYQEYILRLVNGSRMHVY